MKKAEVVKVVNSWLETPYHHRQRVKGKNGGVDCIQFLVGVALEIGVYPGDPGQEIPYYSTEWHLHKNEELLRTEMAKIGMREKPVCEAQVCDVLGFKFGKAMAHLGVLTGKNLIVHALMQPPSKVCQARLVGRLRKRVVACYAFPGELED